MAEYNNDGILSKNDRKTEPNHADHTGSGKLTCEKCGHVNEFWISAWVKTARESGRKFFSLSFRHKQPQQAKPQPQQPQEEGGDVPF